MIPDGIIAEVLLDLLDHDMNATTELKTILTAPHKKDHDEYTKKDLKNTTAEDDDKADKEGKTLPRVNGEDEELSARPKLKLQIDYDENHAARGFQDLKNAGKFWRAAQMMGTRKENKRYSSIVSIVSPSQNLERCRSDK